MSNTTHQLDDRSPATGSLEVYLLGVVDFESSLVLQERLVYEISGRDDTQGTLLICEHPPIVTVGREGSRAHLPHDPKELERREIDVCWLNRGGGCLVHAPGQLAVYPIVPLERLGIGLCDYRDRLEQAVIDFCREIRVPATRRDDAPGLWCRSGQFATVGASVRNGIAYHGLFVNVSPPMDLMRLVKTTPRGERTTSLSAQRVRPTPMHRVRTGLIRHLSRVLGYEKTHTYTSHPLLTRTRRRVYAYA